MIIELSRKFFIVSLLCVASLFSHASNAQSVERVVATIVPGETTSFFSKDLFGTNLQWTDTGDTLFRLDGEMKKRALQRISELPPAIVRFPGGLLSSRYKWKDGVGAQSSRKMGMDFLGQDQKMVVGTDEFLELLAATRQQGIITVNVTRTAMEAADWVKYVRGKQPDAVPHWEIGNESYLNQDPSFMTAEKYVQKVQEFAAEMKKIDPSIKIGAILEGSLVKVPWSKVVIPENDVWNETVAKGTAGVADFYSLHLYSPFDVHKSDKDTLRALQAAPVAMAQNIQFIRDLLKKYSASTNVRITEFNIGTNTPQSNWKYGISLAQAGYVAQMLSAFASSGVIGANYWSLIGNHNFGLIRNGDDPRFRPSGLLFKIMAELAGANGIRTSSEGPIMSYSPLGNVRPGLEPHVAFVQAYKNKGELLALVVNRMPDENVEVSFKSAGFGVMKVTGGQFIDGQSPLAQADSTPSAIKIEQVAAGPKLTLAPCGVAVVKLQ